MKTLKNIAILVLSLCLTLLLLEGVARLFVDFDANYYAAPQLAEKGTVRRHPYGDIPVNSLGYFDGEFKRNGKPSIGYFGDSVAYGVGAGYPYRITEVMKDLQPGYNHLNLSDGIGTDVANISFRKIEELKENYDLSTIIYLMNLNDILPAYHLQVASEAKLKGEAKPAQERSPFLTFLVYLKDWTDGLRGKSMLYTWARNVVKTRFMQGGYDIDGYRSVELHPEKYASLIRESAEALNKWGRKINDMNLRPCIAILPYEMQISADAARTYRDLGINFSRQFENFATQKILISKIQSFIDVIVLGKSFPQRPVGTFYVYDKGDRIDFNHPNRLGHKLLAREMSDARFCQ